MKIAIVGFDIEGRASYDHFASHDHEITICDQKEDIWIPEGARAVLGPDYLDDLDRFDVIVRTAGLPPHVILAKNPDVGSKITTHVNEFMRVCPTKNIIGVTGTKGKGTTSTMITLMLEAAGKTVRLGGNIGLPPLTFLKDIDEDSWVVLELSSFQLTDLEHSPHIGVCVMVVPEHLNWHHDIDDYTSAKSHLFETQTADDVAIYFGDNDTSRHVASSGNGIMIPYFSEPGAHVEDGDIVIEGSTIVGTNQLKLLGQHNWQNACAAVTAVWQVTQDFEAIRSVLTTFSGLPHRIEFVREHKGVSFYNDSFAVGLHATAAAIEAIKLPKVMILGGFDRMLNIDHFGKFAKDNEAEFRKLLLIGQSGPRLAKVLESSGFDNYILDETLTTMPAIVAAATALAQSGDAVVLSPGFASFDSFKNFEDRGLQFKAAVNAL